MSMATTKTPEIKTSEAPGDSSSSSVNDGFHHARRGEIVDDVSGGEVIDGYEAERMRARTALTADEERKLIRRIDWHLMPLCSLIFMFKNLDSDNVSNARIMNKGTHQNIMTQLSLTSDEYALVTALYYVSSKVNSLWCDVGLQDITDTMITWGIMLACNVAVKNKEGLYVTRFFLGLAEAGMFPGIILQMTYWYRPDEMSLRLLYFYICGNLSGIFSGILAFAFDHASGARGLSGWQWLFLVEAIATILLGIAVWFLLPDFPQTASWLTDKEKAFIQARLPSNAPRAAEQDFKLSEIVSSLKDKRLWLFTGIWAFFTVGTSGVRFYQPTVIADLGFTTIAQAQLLNLPITILGLVVIGVTGVIADNGRVPRPVFPLVFLTTILVCYGVMVAYPSNAAVYAVTMIGNAVTAAWFPMMWPWRVQTTSRATGSAFSIGFVNSYGQIGGAIGPQIFRSAYAPRYQVPFAVAMGLVGCCMITTLVTWWVTRRTERDTRKLKLARIAAAKRDDAILDDVVDNDLRRKTAGPAEV
ncbi:putative pantothenate transporter [Annulohypoxylon stygium]|nr:putative pantothenate transporter [Annulohypoxylon stygium]